MPNEKKNTPKKENPADATSTRQMADTNSRRDTKKHINFVSGPMKNKRVSELPGVAGVIGTRLKALGFDKARKVLGQYLILEENQEQFKNWLKDNCGANEENASQCYSCLKEWTEHYL